MKCNSGFIYVSGETDIEFTDFKEWPQKERSFTFVDKIYEKKAIKIV